jgi:hypothetical protein
VSNPHAPREIAFWRCGGAGVHRFTYILAQIIHECRQRRPDGCAGRAAPRGSRDHEVGGRASRGGWAPSCARGPVARSGNGSRRPSRGCSPCAPVRLHGNRSGIIRAGARVSRAAWGGPRRERRRAVSRRRRWPAPRSREV